MKILIISKNSFPIQGPRAFRTAELSEQLAKMGHEVILYSVHGKYDYSSYEKETGVQMRNIHTKWAKRANDGTNRYNFVDRTLKHLFSRTLFFPECEFRFLVPKIIKENPNCDLLITIAFPHSIHSGAAKAKKKYPTIFPKKWIADCGDPFFLNPFSNAPKYFEKYEREWCEACDYITIPIEEGKSGYFPEYHKKIRIIPQGFDFAKTPISIYSKNEIPTFAYAGALYGKRNPIDFIKYLSTIDKKFIFKIYTRTPLPSTYKEILGERLENITGKNRKECIWELSKADFLINFMNPSAVQSPSKLIDYGIAKRPVLDISIPFDNSENILHFLEGDYSNSHKIDNLDEYKIEKVATGFLCLAKE